MTEMQLSLINFPYREMLSTIFEGYSNDFEFTANGIFRKIVQPSCPECSNPMSHNGFNTYQKGHLGEAKVGKYLCGACGKSTQEGRDFWINLKANFFEIITEISTRLRLNLVQPGLNKPNFRL